LLMPPTLSQVEICLKRSCLMIVSAIKTSGYRGGNTLLLP